MRMIMNGGRAICYCGTTCKCCIGRVVGLGTGRACFCGRRPCMVDSAFTLIQNHAHTTHIRHRSLATPHSLFISL